MSFDSLLKPDPYIDVDDVVVYEPNWWRGNVNHEFASWSEDLVGHVSPILIVEQNMGLLGFKGDLPKIHDNVDVARVTNEMMPCGMKKESSTHLYFKLMNFCIL